MKVRVLESHRDGAPIAHVNGILVLFEKGTPQPAPHTEVDIMFSRVLYKRDGQGHLDFKRLSCLVARTDMESFTKVHFHGFETTGGMCATLSAASVYGTRELISITPGRVGVYAADNVNTRWVNGRHSLVAGTGWVNVAPKSREGRASALPRLVGVESMTVLEPFVDPIFVPNEDFSQTLEVDDFERAEVNLNSLTTKEGFTFTRETGPLGDDYVLGLPEWVFRTSWGAYVGHDASLRKLVSRFRVEIKAKP